MRVLKQWTQILGGRIIMSIVMDREEREGGIWAGALQLARLTGPETLMI